MKTMYLILLLILALGSVIKNTGESKSIIMLGASDTLKAQIEITILSNDNERFAKAFDKVKAGEKFQIHIKAEGEYNLSIIYSNNNLTELLLDTLISPYSVHSFPTENKYFIFDGKDSNEKLTVILSLGKKTKEKINKIRNGDLLEYIQHLSKKSKCDISEIGDPLININGNLREIAGDKINSPKYYGISYLIKEYKFNVKK